MNGRTTSGDCTARRDTSADGTAQSTAARTASSRRDTPGIGTTHLCLQTLRSVVTRPPAFPRLVREIHETANRSLLFVAVTMAFFGLILVYEGCVQALSLIPDLSAAGPVTIKTMIRVFGPLFAGLMVAFRVGAGIAAEAGSMVVTDQADALVVSGSSPAEWLVAPRFVACVIAVPILTVFGIVAGVLAGGWLGVTRFDIMPSTFFSLSMVNHGDAAVCILKAVLNGAAIPIVAASAGLSTQKSSEGVGIATTNAVVRSAVAVVIIEFLVSLAARLAGI